MAAHTGYCVHTGPCQKLKLSCCALNKWPVVVALESGHRRVPVPM